MNPSWRPRLEQIRNLWNARVATLTVRDRKMLIGLPILLACAGLYQWGLEPLYARWAQGDAHLVKQEQHLFKVQNKVRQLHAAQAEHDRLGAEMGLLAARLVGPSVLQPIDQVLAEITQAADAAGIDLSSVRPVAATGGGPVQAVTVDAMADSASWVAFMDALWGMRIAEMSLSQTDDAVLPLHVYARLDLLPRLAFAVSENDATHLPLTLAANPFAPKRFPKPKPARTAAPPLAEPVAIAPEPPPPPPPPPSLDLAGVKLTGIIRTPSGRFAALFDGKRERVLGVGDRLRNYAIRVIDAEGVLFASDEGVTGRVDFLKKEKSAAVSTQPATEILAAPPRKPGRLGVKVKATEAGPGTEPAGLLVTAERADVPELRHGDRIVSINGIATPALDDASRVMSTVFAGEGIELGVIRDGMASKLRILALE